MATLVLGAVGTLAGGPIGGVIGALAGQQIDRAIIGSPHREGPRLDELKVTSSSYGTAIARHHGRVRAPGTVIWATELNETSSNEGGVTLYSYSVSFAVALSSRPIHGIGRIWADGKLLRGEAGDLKVGGSLRLYDGHGDHTPDPLIAADKGADCPAFRHTAYAVFEDLQLADFGNRIPALSFEVIADEGPVTLAGILAPAPEPIMAVRDLPGLEGFSLTGGPLAETLAALHPVYPLALDAAANGLSVNDGDAMPAEPQLLPPPAMAMDGEGFGAQGGVRHTRQAGSAAVPGALRYYDPARDYQAGLQRADGRALPGRGAVLELPGTLTAKDARALIEAAAHRAGRSRESLAWRMAELDPALRPGSVVQAPAHDGLWRIMDWEWRDQGIELELTRISPGPARRPAADPGTIPAPPDRLATPTLLQAFELPWDGTGDAAQASVFAAPSSTGAGWTGAALYAERNGELASLGGSGPERCTIGQSASALPPSPGLRLEREAWLDVELASPDFALASSTTAGLANGANRALLGGEVLQFLRVARLGGRRWRLEGLLRGREGTEHAALAGHAAGAPFALIDATLRPLDPASVGPTDEAAILALGLGDAEPVETPIRNRELSLRPPTPVHPRRTHVADGGLLLGWTRRARGAWTWPDEVETPLVEDSEAYRIGLGPPDAPHLLWQAETPSIFFEAPLMAAIASDHGGQPIWVRQVGSRAQSLPLLLFTLP